MTTPTPTFAVVGAVNHGKSSVIATLAEDDTIRISSRPGETEQCQRFWLDDLFCFWDTPGFQNALHAYDELKAAKDSPRPQDVFRRFLERHTGATEFEAECTLLSPIVHHNAGIIYVVDGSKKLERLNEAEMEVLRLTGQPRLAIINRTGQDDFVQDWKHKLSLHFNAIREFNAHYATFGDRCELLDTLASIEQHWKPKLAQAVSIFKEQQQKRKDECVEIIVELLITLLQHSEACGTTGADTATRVEMLREELKANFVKHLEERESQAHQRIFRIFHHSRVIAGSTRIALFDADLFSESTWRLFGLTQKQLIAAGVASGAVLGAATDLLTAGHTLLLGTLLGGAIGAAGAYVVGKGRPDLKVDVPGVPWLPSRWRTVDLSRLKITVGPCKAANFPWILLDRAFGIFYYASNRAHARQDDLVITSSVARDQMEKAGISTSQWEASERKECERIFADIRKGRIGRQQRELLLKLIRERLGDVERANIDAETT